MRIRIASLLLGLLTAISLASLATAAVAWLGLREAAMSMEDLRDGHLNPLHDLAALSEAYAVPVVDAAHKVRNGNFTWSEGAASMASAAESSRQAWVALTSPSASAAVRDRVLATARPHDAAEALLADLRRIVAAQDSDALERLIRERLYQVVDPFTNAIGEITAALVAAANDDVAREAGALRDRLAVVTALAALALLVAGGAGWIVVGRVTRPITRITGAMGALARGDLAVAVPGAGRRDEVGAMAAAVEVFKQGAVDNAGLRAAQADAAAAAEAVRRAALETMATRVEAETRAAVDSVSGQMGVVTDAAGGVGRATARIRAESTSVAEAAREALDATQTVAAATDELSASITEIASQIGRAAQAARSAVDGVEHGTRTIASLQEAVARIGEVAGLIADIAGQTNLLALNATIEAARAGEAGKGFAVVAGEVKSLATQTARRTEDIARQIALITAATAEAVAAVQGIAGSVGALDTIASGIAAAMDQQTLATGEIARAVAGAAGAVRDVEGRMVGVTRESGGSAEAADAMARAARDAQGSVAELRGLLVRIVRTSTGDVDRRGADRVPLRRGAMLELAGQRPLAVNLLDLSEGGAALEAGGIEARSGSEGSLVIGTSLLPVRVVAAEAGRMHLAFRGLSPEARAAIRQMVEGAGRIRAA